MKKIILLLVVSLMMVGVVGAFPQEYGSFQPDTDSGTVEWSTAQAYSGSYSAYLMAKYDYTAGSDSNEVYVHSIDPEITTLNDVDSMSFWYYRPLTGDVLPPQVDIWLDLDGTYTLGPYTLGASEAGDDNWLLGQIPLQEPPTYDEWVQVPFSDITWIKAIGGSPVYGTGSDGLTAAKAETNSGIYATLGDSPVLAIGVGVGSPATRDDTRTMEHQYYIDDIEINGVVYDFEAPTEVWVDDAGVCGNNPCYTTIQEAINIVVVGGTVNVAAGTYIEDLTIDATKTNLELVGAGASTTTIKGVQELDWPNHAPAISVLASGVNIHGFTIESPDYSRTTGNPHSSGITVGAADVEIYENTFSATDDGTGNSLGWTTLIETYGAWAEDVSGLYIHDNTFTSDTGIDKGSEGIYINYNSDNPTPSGTVTIETNVFEGQLFRGITSERSKTTITGNTIGSSYSPAVTFNAALRGIDISSPAANLNPNHDTVSITGDNTVTGFWQGIKIGGTNNTLTNFVITQNTLQSNDAGIRVYSSANGVSINENTMTGNTVGVQNDDVVNTLDATNNWWGTLSPDFGTLISGSVDYSPWCTEETCSEPTLADEDGDGYANDVDCNDFDPLITEATDGSCDGDGDTYIDSTAGGTDCDDSDAGITEATDGSCDGDGDGYIDSTAGGDDCRDDVGTINPGELEVPDNSVDDNCNGVVDEDSVASSIAYSSTWATTVKAALDWLFNRAEQDTDGVSIYLHQGWNTFKLPWFVLTGTAQVNGLNVVDYSVANVLASIDGKYNYTAYYDGTNWHVNSPVLEADMLNDFTVFPTVATQEDFDFHIYMTEGARLTIGLKS